MVDEGLLHRMQDISLRETFNGRDVTPVGLGGQDQQALTRRSSR